MGQPTTFIKIDRNLPEWEWYHYPETLVLFIHLLIKARIVDGYSYGVELKRGQHIFGRKKLSEETGLSEQSIRTSLNRLKSTNDITIKSTNKFSIVTICKYDTYQDCNSYINQQNVASSTSNQPAINQQSTSNQPLTKNIKKLKNEKNDKNDMSQSQKICFSDDIFCDEIAYLKLYYKFGHKLVDQKILAIVDWFYQNPKKKRGKPELSIQRWLTDDINAGKYTAKPEPKNSVILPERFVDYFNQRYEEHGYTTTLENVLEVMQQFDDIRKYIVLSRDEERLNAELLKKARTKV